MFERACRGVPAFVRPSGSEKAPEESFLKKIEKTSLLFSEVC